MTPEQRSHRAVTFRAALEDGIIKDTLNEIEARLIAEWKGTQDALERDNLWRSVQIIDRMRSFMAEATADTDAIRSVGKRQPFIG